MTERYRIQEDRALYYLTFSVVHWLPIFINEDACTIVTDSLSFCHQEKQLRVNAFVIMPTHIHLLVFDADFDSRRLQQTVTAMRKYTGRQLADYSVRALPAVFEQLMAIGRRTDRSRQFWQPTRHPEAIWSERFWKSKIDYIHDNPCRKGLVRRSTDWRFSSAAFWLLDPPGLSDVPLTDVIW